MQTSKPSSFGSKPSGDSGIDVDAVPQVDFNYRGLKVTVFKNGETYDIGTTVVVSRRQFKHWITFLDHLSKKLNMLAPVHKIFTTDGLQIRQFESLQNGGHYVAVSQGPFIPIKYGTAIIDGDKEKEIYGKLARGIVLQARNIAQENRWNTDPHFVTKDVSSLDSAESVDIYLKRCGYGSRTGLPFPFDGVKIFHPHCEPPNIPLSSSAPKTLALDQCTKTVPDSVKDEIEEKPIGGNEGIPLKLDDEKAKKTETKPIRRLPRYDPDFVEFDFFPNIIF